MLADEGSRDQTRGIPILGRPFHIVSGVQHRLRVLAVTDRRHIAFDTGSPALRQVEIIKMTSQFTPQNPFCPYPQPPARRASEASVLSRSKYRRGSDP